MTAEAPARSPDAAAASVGRVERERVTDHVTGLPILRYRFVGPATVGPGMAAPAGAWRVLRVDERDGRTTLDLETANDAEPLDHHPEAVDDAVMEFALATLRGARACGVVHGDLGPQRLWRRGGQVWIEGYGVRWRADADAAGDARDLAAGLLALTGSRLSQAARARLDAIRDTGDLDALPRTPSTPGASDPSGEPDSGGVTAPGSAPTVPGPTADAGAGDPTPKVVRGPPPGSRVRPGGIGPVARATRDAQQGWLAAVATIGTLAQRVRGPARRPQVDAATREAALAGAGAVGLPPETRVRLAKALLVATVAWAALASWGQRAPPAGRPPAGLAGHVVDVTVVPPGQPPVGLAVVASPPGSALAPGSVVGSVPGKVWLDLDGRWTFEARFGDRRSPTVDLILPFERALQLAFPTPAAQ